MKKKKMVKGFSYFILVFQEFALKKTIVETGKCENLREPGLGNGGGGDN